jgi:Zn finger protein HypA/HybF involved in hydrogenase expression
MTWYPACFCCTILNSLRRFLQRPTVRERCELCSAPLAAQHAHLLELTSRQLVCACDPCAILFDAQGAGKYRRAPGDIRVPVAFRLSHETWQALDLRGGRVAVIHVKLGRLSGVVKEALDSAFEMAREGTALAEAELLVEEVPLVIHCSACAADQTPVSDYEVRGPVCGALTN